MLFWQRPDGVVGFEIKDPEIKVVIEKSGPTITGADKKEIMPKPGKHGLTIPRGGFKFDTTTFQLNEGGETRLKVDWLAGNKIQVLQDDKEIGSKVFSAPRRADDRQAINIESADVVLLEGRGLLDLVIGKSTAA